MLRLGRFNTLTAVKKVAFGVYLEDKNNPASERVLLPNKYVPKDCRTGSKIEVFLYKDSSDRLISTTLTPRALLNEVAPLKVKSVQKIGAFLDWGLEKDLFLPYKEQTKKVCPGEEILAAPYIDKSKRLCATMKLYPYLKTDPPYEPGDFVGARIYNISPKFGLFVALEDAYSGLIPKQEVRGVHCVGEKLTVRIVHIREDGKTIVSPNRKSYVKIGGDAEKIIDHIRENEGVLAFDDHAPAELIDREFKISKAAFKRAVGHLLKKKKIEIRDGKIFLI